MSITYQQAKRIRNTGFMSLFADQLMYEKKVTTAIKKTISLKTRGRVMGVTQYLDPLNIAKILTFGSALGPALLGHFTGRDPRDTQYFTGRLKPIREKTKTADKITRLPGGSGGDEGMSIVLRKMYKLMAAQQEDNIKRHELAKNREEEIQIEDERRHKELLDALSGATGGTVTRITTTTNSGGFLGTLGENIKAWVKDFIEKFDFTAILGKIFGGAKALTTLIRFLASNLFRMVLMNPYFLGIASILGMAELLSYAIKFVPNMKEQITPEQALALLKDPDLSENDIESVGGEAKLRYIVEKLPAEAEKLLEEGDAQKIAKAGGADFLWKVAQQTGLTAPPPRQRAKIEKVSPRPDTTGGKNSARAASWDEKYGGLYSPTTGIRYPDDESSNNAEMAKLQRQNDSGMSTPIGVESSKMEAAQSENLKGRVAYGVLKRESSNQVNTTNVNQQPDKTVPLKRAVPSVRMQEESFNEVIFSNTRPAN